MTVEFPPPWNFTWMILTGPERNRDEAATHFARPWLALPDPYTSASPSGESRSQAWRSWAAAKSFTRRVTAPTPHPLVNAISILISPMGSGALVFWHVAGVLALAFLGLAAFRLGREIVSWCVGVVFAAILLTRQLIVERAMLDSIDIPFLAL